MRWILRFPFGEALLWLLSLFFMLSAAGDYGASNAAFLAGTCVLAAIGVRATRTPKPERPNA